MQTYGWLIIYLYCISSIVDISCLNLWTLSVFSGTAYHHIHQPSPNCGTWQHWLCSVMHVEITYIGISKLLDNNLKSYQHFWNCQNPYFTKNSKMIDSGARDWATTLIWQFQASLDEAVYYCGLRTLYIEFGSGTHLIIKGKATY